MWRGSGGVERTNKPGLLFRRFIVGGGRPDLGNLILTEIHDCVC
jgi:hypothetical protein